MVFSNFNYGFGEWGTIGFLCETVNATMTIDYVNPSSTLTKISYTAIAGQGVESTTKIFVGNKGEPMTLEGANDWSYDSVTKVITVTITHSSSQKIIISWDKKDPNVEGYMNTVSVLYGLLIIGFISTLVLFSLNNMPPLNLLVDSMVIVVILAVGGIVLIIVLNAIAGV